jgi:hypothetical protein
MTFKFPLFSIDHPRHKGVLLGPQLPGRVNEQTDFPSLTPKEGLDETLGAQGSCHDIISRRGY